MAGSLSLQTPGAVILPPSVLEKMNSLGILSRGSMPLPPVPNQPSSHQVAHKGWDPTCKELTPLKRTNRVYPHVWRAGDCIMAAIYVGAKVGKGLPVLFSPLIPLRSCATAAKIWSKACPFFLGSCELAILKGHSQ